MGSRSCSPFPSAPAPLEGPWDTPKWLYAPGCVPGDQGALHLPHCFPAGARCVCGSAVSRQRVPGTSWVGLGVSGCQGTQGTSPSSSWLGYPDAIPCLQNISLPMSAPGQHNLPSASAAGWTLGWLLGCGTGFRAQPWDMLQLSMHGHGQLVTGHTVLWGFGPRGASE